MLPSLSIPAAMMSKMEASGGLLVVRFSASGSRLLTETLFTPHDANLQLLRPKRYRMKKLKSCHP